MYNTDTAPLRVLYLLSQRPELTGSGVYAVALMECAHQKDVATGLIAGLPPDSELPVKPGNKGCLYCDAVRFERDLPFPVIGMSDIMPYLSTRWRDVPEAYLCRYEACFEDALRRAVKAFSPHIIHSNHLWVLTALARRLFPEIPILASCHGSDLRQFRTVPHLADRVAEGCRGLDAVLALSHAQTEEIAALYGLSPDRIYVTGAGYAEACFHDRGRRQQEKGSGAPCRMLYAGKLSRAKGIPWLLRACLLLRERNWPFTLDICGSGNGPEGEECCRLAEQLGSRVVLHGNVSQSRLAELFRETDVFVLPSFFEGVPLVLLEALACGCRLVATDLPGVREVFAGVSSALLRRVPLPRLVETDIPVTEDEPAFCEALAEALYRQGEERNTPQAAEERRTLLQRHTWSAVFDRIYAVYAELTGPAAKRQPRTEKA